MGVGGKVSKFGVHIFIGYVTIVLTAAPYFGAMYALVVILYGRLLKYSLNLLKFKSWSPSMHYQSFYMTN